MDTMLNMNGVSLEMLPPGSQFRKTFDRSLMGLEMMSGGGGGGGDSGSDDMIEFQEEQAEKQFEFNKKEYKHQNLTIDRNYEQTILANEISRHQIEANAAYQEDTAAGQWDYSMEVREARYNSQVAAYNKSEQLYGAQIGLNQRANRLAAENARNVNTERQEQLAFNAAKSNLSWQKNRKDLRYQRHANRLGIEQARDTTGLKKHEATLKNQANRAKAAFDSQEAMVQQLKAQGDVKARGVAGNSAARQVHSVIAAAGRQAAAMKDSVTRADSAYNLAMYGLDTDLQYKEGSFKLSENKFFSDVDALDKSYEISKQEEAASKLSIMRSYDTSLKKIEHDTFAANIAADAKRMTKPTLEPMPPKPLSIPRQQILDPMSPIYGPEPELGATYQGSSNTGGGGNAVAGAIGGAMQGAALGTAIAPGIGTAIGAVLGGLAGALGIT